MWLWTERDLALYAVVGLFLLEVYVAWTHAASPVSSKCVDRISKDRAELWENALEQKANENLGKFTFK